nr:MAG: hypothetical protein MPKEOOLM_00004 [Merbecovirus sp. PaGB01]
MRIHKAALLSFVILSILANAFSKPIVSYVPEHCESFTGHMRRACIEQTKLDTSGMYTNLVLASTTSADSQKVTIDRDSSSHSEFYDNQSPTPLQDVGASF